ncbi:MAG: UDP-glucose 4-epimerase [SAR202 cluster bacterium Casp-Chloro-G4]|nr:SDR family NAD(P)-dependent oxidoreductase [Chloroflexota bacterium]MDA1227845.1 SDR family NAD(P)-dependent oxidoreductase [Chloroflexota bacterium]PKB61454.1 MAG: UDP-glucose 4-epimerase [SAR202 cluster bacterium Casp-Chloro-G4]
MKVLVTGGAGFIGSHLVDALIEEGHEVAVIDDLSAGSEANLNPRADFHKADITDFEATRSVFAEVKPQVVSHLAAQTSVRLSMADPVRDATVNVLGSINVVRACVEQKVERVVFASTCAVYAGAQYIPMDEGHPVLPESAYGASKYAVEGYIRMFALAYGLKYKILRYGNVFGPRQNPDGEAGVISIFTKQFVEGVQPTIFGDGTKTRDYVYVGDIVKGNVLAIRDAGDNETYNLAGGKEITDLQVFEAVRKAVRSDMEPKYAHKRPGEVDRSSLDYARARAKLGWSPTVELEDGIGDVVAYYRATH